MKFVIATIEYYEAIIPMIAAYLEETKSTTTIEIVAPMIYDMLTTDSNIGIALIIDEDIIIGMVGINLSGYNTLTGKQDVIISNLYIIPECRSYALLS